MIDTHGICTADGEEDHSDQRVPQNGKNGEDTEGYESSLAD